MRNLLDLLLPDDLPPESARLREERRRRMRVEDYLDHLCAPLVGLVPYADRLALRTETEEHLYALIEDREGDGLSASAAVDAAFKEHGEPWRIGQQFADTYCQAQYAKGRAVTRTFLTRRIGTATLTAFACFGTVSVVNILLSQRTALATVVPEPSPWLLPVNLLSPVLAGILTGALVRVRTGRAVATAMAVVLLHSAAVVLLLWPQLSGLTLFLIQAFWWLPAGLLSAGLASAAFRHLRRTLYLRWAIGGTS